MSKKISNYIEIIFEDEALLIVNKPAGLIVNRSHTTKEKTLQDFLDEYLNLPPYGGNKTSEFFSRSGLAHRLDKDTSGVLVVCKTPEALENLMSQFKSCKIKKEYIALVHGLITEPKIEIQAPIGRNPRNRFKFAVVNSGKPAQTKLEIQKIIGNDYTLVKVLPKTGRTHQIRVHLAAFNHPVAGDRVYSPRNLFEKSQAEFGRLMLHARLIKIIHPLSNKEVTFTASLPEEFPK